MTSSNRNSGTQSDGGGFDEGTKRAVWKKGKQISGKDPTSVRKDKFGKSMVYSEYGNRHSPDGWEIDHIKPVAKGGGDELSNLQPLNWESNVHKGDEYRRSRLV